MKNVIIILLALILVACSQGKSSVTNHDQPVKCNVTYDGDMAYKHVNGALAEKITYSDFPAQINIENLTCQNWHVLVNAKGAGQ